MITWSYIGVYLKVLWYVHEKIPYTLHVKMFHFHRTKKRQWRKMAVCKREHTLTSENFLMWGKDHLLSMCQTSLYTDLHQRSIVLNAGGINSHFRSTKGSGKAVKGSCYKLWEGTTWAGDIVRGKCKIVMNDASEVCQNVRCIFWIWI